MLAFLSKLIPKHASTGTERLVPHTEPATRTPMPDNKSNGRDERAAAIARVIGDHRDAPNLWLARRILEVLDQSPAPPTLSYRGHCHAGTRPDKRAAACVGAGFTN